MAFTTNQSAVAELYIAALGRSPEMAGLNYWVGRLESTGSDALTLTQIQAAFFDNNIAEVAARFPAGTTAAQYVEAIYVNVFGRASDAGGLEYWSAKIATDGADSVMAQMLTIAKDPVNSVDKAYLESKITTAQTAYDAEVAAIPPVVTGDTFVLTAGIDDEIHNGTADNDLFNASALGSLQDDDILLDISSTDADVLNATVNTNATASRIQNVETMNITGEYVKTGFDLTNVSNTKVANFDTKIVGGTATITGANSLNAAKIVAGTNITTLDITSLASGTRDTVTVDAGSADLNLTGKAAGVDSYTATVAADTTVTLGTLNSAGDAITLNVAGDVEVAAAGNGAELDLTINATTANAEVELSGAGSVNAEKIFITGTKDVTLVVTDGVALAGAAGTGTIIADTSTGTSTIEVTTSLGTIILSEAAVDVVEVATAVTAAAALTLNNNTKLNLTADAAGISLTVGLNDNDDDTTFTTGTLRVDVSQAQSKIIATTTSVDTVIVTATPDKAIDLDLDENGTNETSMTMADLQLVKETGVAIVQGSNNLTLSKFTVADGAGTGASAASYVLSAANMTGNLVVSEVVVATNNKVEKITIVGGTGNDTITTTEANKFDVQSGAGNDTINITAAAAGTVVKAGTGNDTVTASVLGATIDLGAGNDTITMGALNTVTLGDGTDTVKLSASATALTTDANTITDFVKGTDVIELQAAVLTADLDVTDLAAPTTGLYTFATATNAYGITLKNGGTALAATNFADSLKLNGVTLKDGSTNTLGNLSDSVKVAAGKSATVTTGTGSDTVTIAAGDSASATNATIKDFTVGTDKIVLTGAITVDLSVNLKNVTDVTGVYTVGDGTAGHSFDIETGGTNITTNNDLTSIVQLGSATTQFKVENTGTSSVNVIGGTFNDNVLLTGKATAATTDRATFTFSNNGGVDTIELATGAGEELLNFNSLTGISTAAGVTAKVDLTSANSKVADAKDGAVYIFDDSTAGIASAKITTFVVDTNNGYTQDVINDEVAAFINAGLGVSAGEKYVVIINDESTFVYADGTNAYANSGVAIADAHNAYVYLVIGDADGVQADNITLIGQVIDANPAVDSTDIA